MHLEISLTAGYVDNINLLSPCFACNLLIGMLFVLMCFFNSTFNCLYILIDTRAVFLLKCVDFIRGKHPLCEEISRQAMYCSQQTQVQREQSYFDLTIGIVSPLSFQVLTLSVLGGSN